MQNIEEKCKQIVLDHKSQFSFGTEEIGFAIQNENLEKVSVSRAIGSTQIRYQVWANESGQIPDGPLEQKIVIEDIGLADFARARFIYESS